MTGNQTAEKCTTLQNSFGHELDACTYRIKLSYLLWYCQDISPYEQERVNYNKIRICLIWHITELFNISILKREIINFTDIIICINEFCQMILFSRQDHHPEKAAIINLMCSHICDVIELAQKRTVVRKSTNFRSYRLYIIFVEYQTAGALIART